MKAITKFSFLFVLVLSFTLTSCGDSDEADDLEGIQLVTSRSNVESEGIGLACNFSNFIEEFFDEIDFDELRELAEAEGEEFDEDQFDEILEQLFGEFENRTMYVLVASDDIDFASNELEEVAGEAFALTWQSETDGPVPGVYQADGVKINVEDPQDLENGAEESTGTIEVILTEVNEESMIGTFSGAVTNREGVSEDIEGAFNVELISCQE